jgi:cobalamin biosynthesis protein CobD/CbiB
MLCVRPVVCQGRSLQSIEPGQESETDTAYKTGLFVCLFVWLVGWLVGWFVVYLTTLS